MTALAFHRLHCALALLFIGAVSVSTTLPAAADASGWDSGTHAAVRLIGAPDRAGAPGNAFRAGIEIKLQPGWKTYWRYPGDSGIPPRFDFSGSENVRDVKVMWPAPMRFKDPGGTSIGYAERVIFPLRVEPADPNAPVRLRLKLDYAICEKLCLPVEAAAQMALPAKNTEQETALSASEARVPRRAEVAAEGSLAIVSVRREGEARSRIVVDVKADGIVDLFAEGPRTDWSLPLPEPLADAPPGLRRFAFEIDGLPPGADPRNALLTLTAVSPKQAIEVVAHLD